MVTKQAMMRGGAFLAVLLLAAFLALRACAGDVDPVEVARVRSPDGQVDAVATESRSGGALGSVLTWVFLVPAGTPITRDVEYAVSAMHVTPRLRLTWLHDGVLEIAYERAVISLFANKWFDSRRERLHPDVELRLRALSERAFQ